MEEVIGMEQDGRHEREQGSERQVIYSPTTCFAHYLLVEIRTYSPARKRKEAVENKQVFSFTRFLREEREKKKKPYTILPEQEFREFLDKKLETELFWGPRSAHVKRGKRPIGFFRKFLEEVYDPWEYEVLFFFVNLLIGFLDQKKGLNTRVGG